MPVVQKTIDSIQDLLLDPNITEDKARALIDQIAMSGWINSQNSAGHTLLHRAAWRNHPTIVSLLLEKGADINARNKYGSTALMLASEEGHINVVSLLLLQKADVNIKNDQGYTAFTRAVYYGRQNIAVLLLAQGKISAPYLPKHKYDHEYFMMESIQKCFTEQRDDIAVKLLKDCIKYFPELAQEANRRLAYYYYKPNQPSLNPISSLSEDNALTYALAINSSTANERINTLKENIIKKYLFNNEIDPEFFNKIILPILKNSHENPILAYEAIQQYQDLDNRTYSRLKYSSSEKDSLPLPTSPPAPLVPPIKLNWFQQIIQYFSDFFKNENNIALNIPYLVKQELEKETGKRSHLGKKDYSAGTIPDTLFKEHPIEVIAALNAILANPDANAKLLERAHFVLASYHLGQYNTHTPGITQDEKIALALKECLALPSIDKNGNDFYYRFKEQIVNVYLANTHGNFPDILSSEILVLIKTSHKNPKLAYAILSGEKQMQGMTNKPEIQENSNSLVFSDIQTPQDKVSDSIPEIPPKASKPTSSS